MLDKGKSDIKGKAVEQNDAGHEVIDLTSDNGVDLAPDNASDEREDHNLVKKLLSFLIGSWNYFKQTTFPHKLSESHGQTWASGKLFPWKQLPQKLGQNALVCINWPDAVLFPGQECSSCSKPKGISDLTISECTQIVAAIRDTAPHRLHFKSAPNSKCMP